MSLISIRDLSVSYFTMDGEVKAVRSVDLEINKREIVGLVGESGCGKSTLGLSIMRLIPDPPAKIIKGQIIFEGEDLLRKSTNEIRKIRGGTISMIFQDPLTSLNPVYNIGNQVSEAFLTHLEISDPIVVKNKTIGLLKKVEISDAQRRLSSYPHEFSGGMRQRVMIAMAISCNPKLIIADEPTTNLDVTIQAQILDLLRDLKEEFDSSILLITHNMGVVAEMADKIAVMYAGRIVEFANSLTLFENPFHPYTKALLKAIPRIDVEEQIINYIPGDLPSPINPPKGCAFNERCKYTNTVCKQRDPQLIELEGDHLIACHNYSK